MAERMVLLGPIMGNGDDYVPALEMSALDASASINGGMIQAYVAQYGGDLADAMTFRLSDTFVATHSGRDEITRQRAAWASAHKFLRGMHGIKEIRVSVPLGVERDASPV